MQPLTIEEFSKALPEKLRKGVDQQIIDKINATLSKPEEFEHYRNNLLSFTKILQEGKFSLEQYLNAVKYVSYKLMGLTNQEAYARTFPDRMQRLSSKGTTAKELSAYVAAYNKSQLVNLIYEQTLIPAHILNQDLFQRALNVQAGLMMGAKSEKVRCDAANSLLNHLKPPEVKKVEMDIGVREDSSIASLREATIALAKQQRMLLEGGYKNAQEIAHSQIIDVTPKEIT